MKQVINLVLINETIATIKLLNDAKKILVSRETLIDDAEFNIVLNNLFASIKEESEKINAKDVQLELDLTPEKQPKNVVITEENGELIKKHNEQVRKDQEAAEKAKIDHDAKIAAELAVKVANEAKVAAALAAAKVVPPVKPEETKNVPVAGTSSAPASTTSTGTTDKPAETAPVVPTKAPESETPRFATLGEAIEALQPLGLEQLSKGRNFGEGSFRQMLNDRIIKTFPLNSAHTVTKATPGATEEDRREANKIRNSVIATVQTECERQWKQSKLDKQKKLAGESPKATPPVTPPASTNTTEKEATANVAAPKSEPPVIQHPASAVDQANAVLDADKAKDIVAPAGIPDKTLEVSVDQLAAANASVDADGFTAEDVTMMKQPLVAVKNYIARKLVEKGVKTVDNDIAANWAIKFLEVRSKKEELDPWMVEETDLNGKKITKAYKFVDRVIAVDVVNLRKAS